ncbi:SUF system NifU family Fe-S cluster assembly protein [Brachybacterium sp. EF45031]|uniref:Fe-S cluster assembly sulfur transfer protein SufU n=1 Tax=Brachybacterium sillae TaxID=2810536 RepID=UPI00217D598B|nr:SUF system NifU family Fe-S cluster assembly protein [Brachybacterium sillae]MCS6710730.1 SUF system NifU family Fe-S cluster assembly protein [Brachybacterium sillae]
MSDLSSLYTGLIIEHDRRPHRAGLREPYAAQVHHVNPTCGDEITLRLDVDRPDDDGTVRDVSYDAIGCAMSRASASMLADQLTGLSVAQAVDVVDSFEMSMASRGKDPGNEELLGDAVALLGASKFPARVKCVLLPWKAFRAALLEAQASGGRA